MSRDRIACLLEYATLYSPSFVLAIWAMILSSIDRGSRVLTIFFLLWLAISFAAAEVTRSRRRRRNALIRDRKD